MKTYFLTGGEGFIGYHIVRELLKDKDNRIVLYDAQKHYIPFARSNWAHYQQYRSNQIQTDQVTSIRGDCTDRGWLKECLETHKPDVIIHLAALPIAGISNNYPAEAKINILDSTVTLLDVLRSVNFEYERVVYTSSSMVYGHFQRDDAGHILPAREDQPCNPIGIYGAMKISGEHVVRAYNHRFKIPYTIIRPSAAYGPTDCNQRVTEIFLMNALKGKELILDSGGKHQLDFTYVEDLAKGFVLASNSLEALGETFNLTRGEGRPIKELAEVVKRLVPEAKIVEKNIQPYQPNRGALDISKAKEILGYNPSTPLEEGMKKYHQFVTEFQTHTKIY